MIIPKKHPNVLNPNDTILIVIDAQEALLRTLFETERLQHNLRILVQGATILRMPILSTTQNAAKLGEMVPDLRKLLPPLMPPFNKMTFSCYANEGFASEINRAGRKKVLLCGGETHICVEQTAHDLITAGFQVHVVADAVSSRTELNWRIGLDKMRQAGVLLSSVEMAFYEMLHEAGTKDFREILELIKTEPPVRNSWLRRKEDRRIGA